MIGALLLLLLGVGRAEPSDTWAEINLCLNRQDVACAEAVVERERLATSSEAPWRAVAAEVAFAAGDYPRAVDLLESAVAMGLQDADRMLDHYRRTLYATAGWVEVPRGRFRIRYRPGPDVLLVDDAGEVLNATDRHVTPLLGPVPPGNTVAELFPSGRSFVAASSLTLDDVRTTGVVALSKFTRLLVTTPRARSTGYPWKSTLSHEYIHLVVMHATHDRAPVWLQEGIASYLDDRWRTGADTFRLSPEQEGYLAAALGGAGLVPFEEMHPSLAKIKVLGPDGEVDRAASAKRSQLAYAQLATLIAYAFEKAGPQVLLRVLPRVRDGEDPREALRKEVGAASFDELLRSWEAWIRAKGLIDRGVDALPVVLDGGSGDEADPVLARRKDLSNAHRLGELLALRGHPRAALVAYDKARASEEGISPALAASTGRAWLLLGDAEAADEAVKDALEAYPDFVDAWRVRAEARLAKGDVAGAAKAAAEVVELAPFAIDDQERLADLLRRTKDAAALARVEADLRLLRRGGEDAPPQPIHVRYGEYELPRDPSVAKQASQASRGSGPAQGAPAPEFTVDALDGRAITSAGLVGKVVILDFWATWCGPCRSIMPKLSELAERRGAEGLVVLGISDEPTSVVKRWLAQEEAKGKRYAQTMALEGGAVRRAYGVGGIPHLVVIDREGRVRKVHVGAGDLSDVTALVDELLSAPARAPDR